jgi:hypothetical protein
MDQLNGGSGTDSDDAGSDNTGAIDNGQTPQPEVVPTAPATQL